MEGGHLRSTNPEVMFNLVLGLARGHTHEVAAAPGRAHTPPGLPVPDLGWFLSCIGYFATTNIFTIYKPKSMCKKWKCNGLDLPMSVLFVVQIVTVFLPVLVEIASSQPVWLSLQVTLQVQVQVSSQVTQAEDQVKVKG